MMPSTRLPAVLGLAIALFGLSVPSSAQTVDELIAKNLQAKGGPDRLRAVTSVRQASQITVQGMPATMVVNAKRPNFLRQEVTLGNERIVNGFDGATPWTINTLVGARIAAPMTGPPADVLREQSHFDGAFVDYKSRGASIELVGRETVDGRVIHHLKVAGPGQPVQHYYLDADSGLETMIVTESETGPIEQRLSDYRFVNGVQFPFAIVTTLKGVVQSKIAVTRVEINVPVADDIFKMPR